MAQPRLGQGWAQLSAAAAALRNVPQSPEHLAAIAGVADALAVLQQMQQRGPMLAASPRFRLAGALAQEEQQAWDLASWREKALAHYTTWTEGKQGDGNVLLEEREPIMRALE